MEKHDLRSVHTNILSDGSRYVDWQNRNATHSAHHSGVFSKWRGTFIEFSEFRESEESLKHELGSV